MKNRNLPEPEFLDQRSEFYNDGENAVTESAIGGLTTQGGVPDAKGLLKFCRTPWTRGKIVEYLDIASGQYALRRYLDPLVASGAIRLTLPDKPRSPERQHGQPRDKILIAYSSAKYADSECGRERMYFRFLGSCPARMQIKLKAYDYDFSCEIYPAFHSLFDPRGKASESKKARSAAR